MIVVIWLRGLLSSVSGRIAGAIIGVGLTIALLAAVGSFTAASAVSMTRQAIADVPVDWQVQINHGADIASVKQAIGKATAYSAMQEVFYADVPGFELIAGGSAQTTGAGKVVGITPQYQTLFGAEIRPLIGSKHGVLLAQQTSANLHARVGDVVVIKRNALPPARVRIDGIVDLPDADAFFQAVGLPPGAAPQAPPDNVLLLPAALWHRIFDPQTIVRPDSTRTQLHVRITHDLPGNPLAAYTVVDGAAKNVEARVAGSALIGDNLGAKLLSAQADALYARVLFLFLGLPGVMLAILITIAVATSGAQRRRREQALLRVRGASTAQIVTFSAVEGLVVGLGGVLAGAAIFAILHPHPGRADAFWFGGAALAGFIVAAASMTIPALVQARSQTVSSARAVIGREADPLWQRIYLDFLLLAVGALFYWQAAANGYQVVLAPEGIPQSSVHYEAFLGPLLFWLGGSLLAMRIARTGLLRWRAGVESAVRPLAGSLAPVVSASLSRQHKLVVRGIALVLLAFSFGIATAVFNSTYNAQAIIDAQLTNGADVTVTGQTASPPSRLLPQLRAIPEVIDARSMQHRFAYVGNDLQDLYGIDPARISAVTPMSNAFFGNGDAKATLAKLAAHPDGVLVSEETVTTYQLHDGDRLTLRLQNARMHRYTPVAFHFVGISREFPTAPRDSFLVANASYVARQTGTSAGEIVLLRVAPGRIDAVSHRAAQIVSALPGAKVSTVLQTQRNVGSSLTAVDLRGLTAIELLFAVVFIGAATGLMLALGFAERRRTFAVLSAIGAAPRQLGAFLWSEAALVLVSGGIFGIALGFWIAQTLVRVLTGVFDPPPEALVVPWPYVAALLGAAVLSMGIAVIAALAAVGRSVVFELRRL
jgi:putative ABC transport system permease protein